MKFRRMFGARNITDGMARVEVFGQRCLGLRLPEQTLIASLGRPPERWRFLTLVVAILPLLLLLKHSALAYNSYWKFNPVSDRWDDGFNWIYGVPFDVAVFSTSNTSTVSVFGSTVKTIIFSGDDSNGASAYTIVADAFQMTISGFGIINNSGKIQNFVSNAPGGGAVAGISFTNSATAGNLTNFTNFGGATSDAAGGYTQFLGTATAGTAGFTNNGLSDLNGGATYFGEHSTAANGTFFNNGGRVTFNNTATAGAATITNSGASNSVGNANAREFLAGSTQRLNALKINRGGAGFLNASTSRNDTLPLAQGKLDVIPTTIGPHAAGSTGFFDTASAGNATLVAEPGLGTGQGGIIYFGEDSVGGTARIELFGNGALSIDGHNLPGVTTGSIEGSGLVFLGTENNLTVGSNNLSTTFSGVIEGDSFGASFTKIGVGTLILSGASTYDGPTTINAGKLVVDGSISSDVTINSNGILGGKGTVGNVTVNSGGKVAPGDPQTLTVGGNYQQASGARLALVITGTVPAAFDQLVVTGDIILSSGSVLELDFTEGFAPHTDDTFDLLTCGSVTGTFSTIDIVGLEPGFQYSVASDGSGHIQLTALNDAVATTTTIPSNLLNISTRLSVQTGDNVMICGFIITGSDPKNIMVRGIGPSLALFGVEGALANPTLELHGPDGTIVSNDNWRDKQEQEIINTTIPPTNDLESAIVATLAPGAYTVIMDGKDEGTGVGLVEAYDLDPAAVSRLVNISTRGFVDTGDNVMIGGFIVGGGEGGSTAVVVRAIGPSLAIAGVVQAMLDPTIELHDQDGTLFAFDDNWKDSQQLQVELAQLAPTDDRESAIAATLSPGAYTVIMRGRDDSTGVGLVEVYKLQ